MHLENILGVFFLFSSLLTWLCWFVWAEHRFPLTLAGGVAFAISIAEFLLYIQILSLVSLLNGIMLATVWGLSAFAKAAVFHTYLHRDLGMRIRTAFLKWMREALTGPAILAAIIFLFSIVLLACLGATIQPVGDSYHFTRPLYWMQHESIASFPIQNYRVNAFAMGPDALTLPFYMYFGDFGGRVAFATLAVFGIALFGQYLSRQCGASAPAALIAGITLASATVGLNGLFYGWSDMLLPATFIILSVCLLLEAGCFEGRESFWFYGMAIFTIILGAALKNTVIFILPGFFLIALASNWKIGNFRIAILAAACAWAAAICSGMVWNYGANYLFYGNVNGPAALMNDSKAPLVLKDSLTRVARGVLHLLDVTYTPPQMEPLHRKIKSEIADFTLASRTLPGERLGTIRYFDRLDTNDRKGYGWPGLIALSAVVWWGVRCLYNRRSTVMGTNPWVIAAILASVLFAFIGLHVMVVWTEYGRLRYVYPAFVLVSPVLALCLTRKNLQYAVAIVVSIHSLLLVGKSAIVAYPLRQSNFGMQLGSQSKNLSDRMIQHTAFLRLESGLEISADVSHPSEVYRLLAKGFSEPVTFGLIAGQNSQEYYLFGASMRNAVIPLVPGDPNILRKLSRCDWVVTDPGLPLEPSLADRLKKYGEVVDMDGETLLLIYAITHKETIENAKWEKGSHSYDFLFFQQLVRQKPFNLQP